MKLFVLTLLFMLAACGETDVIYKSQPVETPIPVTCKTKSIPVPEWQVDKIKGAGPMFQRVQALIADKESSRSYDAQLVAANEACQ